MVVRPPRCHGTSCLNDQQVAAHSRRCHAVTSHSVRSPAHLRAQYPRHRRIRHFSPVRWMASNRKVRGAVGNPTFSDITSRRSRIFRKKFCVTISVSIPTMWVVVAHTDFRHRIAAWRHAIRSDHGLRQNSAL